MLLKTKVFEKKGKLSSEKNTFASFFPYYPTDYDRRQGTICKGPESVLTNTVEVIRSFL